MRLPGYRSTVCLALAAAGRPPAPLVAPRRDWDQKVAAANGCRRDEKLLPPATAENDYHPYFRMAAPGAGIFYKKFQVV